MTNSTMTNPTATNQTATNQAATNPAVTSTAMEPSPDASSAAMPGQAAEASSPTVPWSAPRPTEPPIPLLAPYFGVVAAMLCMLIGAWLLLAPYAFDYRRAAAKVPQSTTVDLATGGAAFAVAALTAILFASCIARRLRAGRRELAWQPQPAYEPGPVSCEAALFEAVPGEAVASEAASSENGRVAEELESEPELEPELEPILAPPLEESFSYEPHKPPLADPEPPEPGPAPEPGVSLRDLLAPLVAALTADLNSRERERDSGYGYGAARASQPSGGRGPDA